MNKNKGKGDIFDIIAAKQGKTAGEMIAERIASTPIRAKQEEKLPGPMYFPDPDATPEEVKEFLEREDL